MTKRVFNIVYEGCCHGELDKIYYQIKNLGKPVDLVLIGGDFQAVRNEQDLNCMAVPPKYRRLGDFEKYYNGEKKAPYLTIFIGGNHEASNYLWELYYGGWVAPNIYYLGAAGVVNFKGLRIGGLSGIWNQPHYNLGHFERLPYDRGTERSCYHIRQYDTMKLSLINNGVDIMMSHDWPQGIERFGNLKWLLNVKKHFRQDVDSSRLGSPPARALLESIRPQYWLSAHLHVRYAAKVNHSAEMADPNIDEIRLDLEEDVAKPENEDEITLDLEVETQSDGNKDTPENHDDKKSNHSAGKDGLSTSAHSNLFRKEKSRVTSFLALDKCLPGRKFIELLKIETTVPNDRTRSRSPIRSAQSGSRSRSRSKSPNQSPVQTHYSALSYDPEWLAITRVMHKYFSISPQPNSLPSSSKSLQEELDNELAWVDVNITSQNLLSIPKNFVAQVPRLSEAQKRELFRHQPREYTNNQTKAFCELLHIDNLITSHT